MPAPPSPPDTRNGVLTEPSGARARLARLLRALAVVAAIVTIGTWASGGIRVSPLGIRVSSSNVLRPFLVAAIAWIVATALSPQRASTGRLARIAVPLAVFSLASFTWWHVAPYAAAADMFGYVSQALDWRAGSLAHPEWLRDRGEFPVATAVPLGYVLRTGGEPAAVALYPPGTSLHMALASQFGSWAMYLVSPLAAVALVIGTNALGRRWFDEDVGRIGAVLTATSPIVLAQAIVPMSDALAAAYWVWSLACAASARWPVQGLAGGLAGLAIAVRPNLAPLLGPVLACSLWAAGWRGGLAAVVGCGPVVAWLGTHNARLYGEALATGYGAAGDLFSLAHVGTNLRNYGTWLLQSMSPLPLIGTLLYAGWAARRRPAHLWLVAFVVLNVTAYLVYLPWPHWTFARFLLPAIPPMLLMTAAMTTQLTGRRRWASTAVVLVVLGWQLQFAHASELRHTRTAMSRFAELPRRMTEAGLLAQPVVTRLHSGSLRLYAGARTYRWDHMSPQELRHAIEDALARGQQPLLVDDSDDREAFEAKFGPVRCWADEATPLVQLERHAVVRVFPMRPGC